MFSCVTTVDHKDVVIHIVAARALFGTRRWWSIATPISISVAVPVPIAIRRRWRVIGEENKVVFNFTIVKLSAPVPAAHAGK
jgi:hypothetical protein